MRSYQRIGLGLLVALAATQVAAQVRVFEDSNFRGRAFTVDRAMPDLSRAGFNDRASSVVVRSGSWQLCSDGRFGGRCVNLGPGRYPSLEAMGMNDRVSSIRPARRQRR
jgi:hypothetical protein